MDITKYKLFVKLAETLNFTKTGDAMGYTQPGVSHMLKTMEESLGFPLFLRTKNGVYLTPNGKEILPYVRQLLAVNEQLEQEVAALNGLSKGHLTIACFASISRVWLPKIIHSFQADYPGIEIELLEGGTDDIVSWVHDGAADFGLLSHRHLGGLNFYSLCEDPLVAIFPREEPYLSMDSFPARDLDNQPFILSAEGTDYDIHHMLNKTKVKPDIRFTSKDDHAIVSMVSSHLGISVLPELVIRDVAHMITYKPLTPSFSRDLGVAYTDKAALTIAAKSFIETLNRMVKVEKTV